MNGVLVIPRWRSDTGRTLVDIDELRVWSDVDIVPQIQVVSLHHQCWLHLREDLSWGTLLTYSKVKGGVIYVF